MSARWPHDPAEAWVAYQPSAQEAWNVERVLQLHRRAGFGATWSEVRRDLAEGYEASIDRVVNGAPSSPDGRPAAAIEAFTNAMHESYRNVTGDLGSIRLVWFYRMVFSPWPLRERMLLAWHTHYATSEVKVSQKSTLTRQHEEQRKLWRGRASQIHLAMLRDHAMLYWLDGVQNRRGASNENLAREFLELFSLGVGNYSEHDVRETARALTGWQRVSERAEQLKYLPALHDPTEKSILGQQGKWTDEDVVRIVCAHPAAARRIAWRLWRTFISDVDEPSSELLEGLAATMRVEGNVDVARGLETLLRSRLFHSDAYVGRRVLSPVEWIVTTIRAGETFPPRPDLTEVVAASDAMSQRLFQPPNVAGWPGGLDWLTGAALVARQNFAAWLTSEESQVAADHWSQLAARAGATTGQAELNLWTNLLWGRQPSKADGERLSAQSGPSQPADSARLVRAVLCDASAQLA